MIEKYQPEPGFSTEINVVGAYDRRFETPNYGIHGAEIYFALKGPHGAVELQVFTEWHVPTAREHLLQFEPTRRERIGLTMASVTCHSPKPLYEGQQPNKQCSLLGETPCYSDCSFSMAEEWTEDFIAKGTPWLWPRLRDVYRSWLEPKGDQSNG